MLNVIFDMDGVILDTEALSIKTWSKSGEKFGISDAKPLLTKCMGCNLTRMLEICHEEMGEDFPALEYLEDTWAVRQQMIEQEGIPLKKGARSILSFLRDIKAKVALASSTGYEEVVRELCAVDLLSYFQVIVGGDQITKSKPDPQIYLTACEKLGISPDDPDTYAVEDSYNGVRSASNAGIKTFMVPDILPPTEEMEQRAFQIFPDLTEVKNYLERTMNDHR